MGVTRLPDVTLLCLHIWNMFGTSGKVRTWAIVPVKQMIAAVGHGRWRPTQLSYHTETHRSGIRAFGVLSHAAIHQTRKHECAPSARWKFSGPSANKGDFEMCAVVTSVFTLGMETGKAADRRTSIRDGTSDFSLLQPRLFSVWRPHFSSWINWLLLARYSTFETDKPRRYISNLWNDFFL